MRTLSTCELAVSFFPKFAYKAQDGGGGGSVERLGNGKLRLAFDPAGVRVYGACFLLLCVLEPRGPVCW
jgi:hypothetical protein